MKTLKENFFGNLGIGKVAKIEEWLKKYKIANYTINPDLTIDVKEFVDLTKYPDKELPEYIQFNYVKFIFNISNSNITSLKGAPKKCKDFYCNSCKNLISLEGAPKVCEKFDCRGCKNLTSLEGAPKECEYFDCDECDNLKSLKGAPEHCKIFDCSFCKNLTSLKGAPKECELFHCVRYEDEFTKDDVKKVCNAKIIKCK